VGGEIGPHTHLPTRLRPLSAALFRPGDALGGFHFLSRISVGL